MNVFGPIVIPLLLTATALAGPVSAVALAPPVDDAAPLLVVGPDAEALVRQAGGDLIGPERAPLAVIAQGEPGFAQRLDGAWLVIDARWLLALCTPSKG